MRRKIGIYNLHLQAMGGGERMALVLAEHLSQRHDVSLISTAPIDAAGLEEFFEVDLSRINLVTLEGAGSLAKAFARLRRKISAAVSRQHYAELRELNLDLFINNSYGSELICPARRGIFMCMFPHAAATDAIHSYETIVAISEYSATWVQQRWQRTSAIVHPPCDDMGPPETKRKIILHVGRFIADSDRDERHHKSQALLLTTFRQLSDLHQAGWEFHLAGSVGSHQAFANSLVQAARGLPIVFHFNSSREQLRNLYRHAAIYWHATGHGVDAQQYPGKQEHFGISTVEAMSAGAVPLVYASGGQKEIVTNGVDGLWWNRIDELVSQTRALVANEALGSRFSENAVRSSTRFSRQTFLERMDELVD